MCVYLHGRFYASVITRELGLNNNLPTDTYNNAGGLSANDIINKNIRDLKIKFGIDNIPIENNRLTEMYSMPKMHKNTIKARFIIVSPKSAVKPLARTITSIFRLFLDKYKHIVISVGFLQVLTIFGY